MKKLLILIILLLILCTGCKEVEKEILLSQSTIQKITEKKFPIEKGLNASNIKLFSPQVFFQENSIGLSVQYSAFLLISGVGGNVTFTCRPVYNPENATFYMNDFVMTKITMNNATYSDKDKNLVLISSIINSVFKDYPLYTLSQVDYKQNLTQMVLKNVSVRGNNLVLLMSF